MSIKKMQEIAHLIDNSDIGYNQSMRWTFFNGKTIIKHKECDCSTCCGVIARLGGYNVNLSGTFYTGNFAAKLKTAGFSIIKFNRMSQLKPGDFVVKPGHHVEFVYSEDLFFSAHIDERGRASGGKPGNQTKKEVAFSKAYNYSGGWTFICRPPAEKKVEISTKNPTPVTTTKPKVTTFKTYVAKVTVNGLNFRDKPSIKGKVLTVLKKKNKVRVMKPPKDGWAYVRRTVKGKQTLGYVNIKYISK